MSTTGRYRQQISIFRERLNKILDGAGSNSGRTFLDSTGNRTRAVPHSNQYQRLVEYGRRRHNTVARILAIFEITRRHENLEASNSQIYAEPQGAVWQAYKGSTSDNACHTCPTYVTLNGQSPTSITANRGLQRFIILEFSDCMLMPRSINEVDIALDDGLGKIAFADAVECVLNTSTDWLAGLELYKDRMRDLMGDASYLLTRHKGEYADVRLNALMAYYEGLYLQNVSGIGMSNFVSQVEREMNIG